MTNCIICHKEIKKSLNGVIKCPNGHPIHDNCFKEWIVHSKNCPLCHEPYPPEILAKYEGYLKQLEKERLEEEKRVAQEKAAKKIEVITEKIHFLKFIEALEFMIEKKQYNSALAMLNGYDENHLSKDQKQKLLFLRGKINYFRERYDLAIGSLFKLVKENFNYPKAFYYLGKAYEALGLVDKAKWAFDRVK
ncbi:MAG: RING finger domain-containing protein [Promethearchaeota archaeon]